MPIQSEPKLLAGFRSLGIIHKHITEHFWRLVEHADVHVLDISAQVQNPLMEKLPMLFMTHSQNCQDENPVKSRKSTKR